MGFYVEDRMIKRPHMGYNDSFESVAAVVKNQSRLATSITTLRMTNAISSLRFTYITFTEFSKKLILCQNS